MSRDITLQSCYRISARFRSVEMPGLSMQRYFSLCIYSNTIKMTISCFVWQTRTCCCAKDTGMQILNMDFANRTITAGKQQQNVTSSSLCVVSLNSLKLRPAKTNALQNAVFRTTRDNSAAQFCIEKRKPYAHTPEYDMYIWNVAMLINK